MKTRMWHSLVQITAARWNTSSTRGTDVCLSVFCVYVMKCR
jgi:hypothetical protein